MQIKTVVKSITMEVAGMEAFRKVLLFTVMAVLLAAIAGCNVPKVEKVNVDEVKVYADPAAEKILSGINEKNYAKFSEDFDQKMKEALSEEKFNEIIEQLGQCESLGITGADSVQGYTRAFYSVKSSKFSGELTFTIVFSPSSDKKVAGLFYK